MVYLDNAATTYPKPSSVITQNAFAMVNYGANPGRSGHLMSLRTAEAVYNARKKCADFFGAQVENTCFTLNCTAALNIAIKGIATPYCHIITGNLEHNAVIRPIYATAKENGISYSVAEISRDDDETLENIRKLVRSRTTAVVMTAASNVTGQITPLRKIGEFCRRNNICFIVDAAQAAGIIPLKLSDGINIICAAGHKGLYGPMGTGLLITDGKYRLRTIIEGGTGSASKEIEQPEFLPDRFESGTINTSGAIALGYGVDFVREKGIDVIRKHEHGLCEYAFSGMKKTENVILYSESFPENSVPIISFNLRGKNSEETAAALSEKGFYLRGGYHCAFMAHKALGTAEGGTVRFAPSVFTAKSEVTAFLRALKKL